jgi:hypothetical protein
VGNIPAKGFKLENPMLTRDGNGEMHLQKDAQWQARYRADQFSEGKVINRILTVADVGPEAP